MANVKISGLTAAGSVAGANEFEINEAGISKKVTGAQIAAHVLGGSYGATLTGLTVDTNVLHVDATNNRVGIGNTTPTVALDVSGSATVSGSVSAGSATVTGNLTVDTNTLYVDATNNRVGIGNTSPTEALDVTGTARASTFELTNWTITESAGVLYFATGGTNKAKLDASGNFTVVGNVTAYGTV
jgi:hypothetical protein